MSLYMFLFIILIAAETQIYFAVCATAKRTKRSKREVISGNIRWRNIVLGLTYYTVCIDSWPLIYQFLECNDEIVDTMVLTKNITIKTWIVNNPPKNKNLYIEK